ncbi:hypothetical protein KSX_87020 [Ktedonospora formicarum]|uniref:Uncharacterized protein n=1 Tax=Ktedonospora formicarum TaxID=2778364 RepID=A0A8J3IEJ9_9CHLR|nr:hypothetical protein KSX_87020 [Ktedonospora formicarum]
MRDTETNASVLLGGNAALRLLHGHLVLPLMGLPLLQRKATQRGTQLDLTYRTSSLSHSDDIAAQEPLFSSEHIWARWDKLVLHFTSQAGYRASRNVRSIGSASARVGAKVHALFLPTT